MDLVNLGGLQLSFEIPVQVPSLQSRARRAPVSREMGMRSGSTQTLLAHWNGSPPSLPRGAPQA